MCVEGLTRKALGRNRLLLRINPLSILILRTDQNGAGRTHGRDAIARYGAVASEHKHVIAQDLVVIGGEVATIPALVVTIGHFAIGLHREMTPKATGHP